MATIESPRLLAPDPQWRRKLEELSGQKISSCYQCEKCTSGCPLTFAMDVSPHRLMHLLVLGLADRVLRSSTIWVCASCQTCTTRCPNGIDIAHVMDTLRQLCRREGLEAAEHSVPVFHSAFLSSVKRHGRVHEGELALTYALKDSGLPGLMKLSGTGIEMFRKGKIKLLPSRVRAIGKVKEIFSKAESL